MAPISGVDFYRGQWENGTTNAAGLADMAAAGVQFMIAKVGQAFFIDSRWTEHKAKLLELGGTVQKGAYWFLERDHPSTDVAGYFYPPWPAGMTFQGLTYGGHSNYSVDWNRGSGSDDLGINVLAAQGGTVTGTVGGAYGEVTLDHISGYKTQYVHMRGIIVTAGQVVTRGQKIGEVGATFPNGTISPHLHHVHFRNNVRIKQVILGNAIDVSIGNSDTSTFPIRYGESVTGVALPTGSPSYTGTTQASRFLNALDGDPTGWFCAVDIEAPPTAEYGISPNWRELRQFRDEFHRRAPGYPLFIYTRKGFWNANIKDASGSPINARAEGFAGTWTADYTQIGSVYQTNFDAATASLAFTGGYAGNYAGFASSRIIQFGALRVRTNGALRSLDGNAFDGTLRQLKALATGAGDPDPTTGTIPNLYGLVEAAALSTLTAAGFTAGTRTTDYHVTLPAGQVISTDPEAGTAADTGTAVAYVVSLGPRTNTTVPYVLEEEESAALASLTAVSLVAGTRTTANHATIIAGHVISTSPVAGTAVALNSAVAYVVSLGPVATGSTLDPTPASPCA